MRVLIQPPADRLATGGALAATARSAVQLHGAGLLLALGVAHFNAAARACTPARAEPTRADARHGGDRVARPRGTVARPRCRRSVGRLVLVLVVSCSSHGLSVVAVPLPARARCARRSIIAPRPRPRPRPRARPFRWSARASPFSVVLCPFSVSPCLRGLSSGVHFFCAFATSAQVTSTKPCFFRNSRNDGLFTRSRSYCLQAAPQLGWSKVAPRISSSS